MTYEYEIFRVRNNKDILYLFGFKIMKLYNTYRYTIVIDYKSGKDK